MPNRFHTESARRIAVVIAFLFSSPLLGRGGNGDGFNGGDPVHLKLQAAQSAIRQSFEWIAKDYTLERLCNPRFCAWDDASCDTIRPLAAKEQSTCRNFIRSSADQYLALLKNNPSRYFIVKSQTLNDPAAKGNVAAITKSDPEAPITFDRSKIVDLLPQRLIALLVHEYGHKIRVGEAYISDGNGPEGFQTGRQFLDTVGLAIAQYHSQLPASRNLANLGLSRLYRSYHLATESHFFTISKIEHDNVVHLGNRDESDSFAFHVFAYPAEGTVPVYRFRKKSGQVSYHASVEAPENEKVAGFEPDGIAFYVWKERKENTYEIFRMDNSLGGASLFTVSPDELAAIKTSIYWKQGPSLGFIPKN